MPSLRLPRAALALLALTLGACLPKGFEVANYPTSDALYRASLEQFERGKHENAIAGFEKLTFELPARDTLLPRAYWYLARARAEEGQHLLAAQSFIRMAENFPDDTLADDALFSAGHAYARLWRKPSLDPQYGLLALSTFQSVGALYPGSPLADEAEEEAQRLTEMLARKDYETGLFYLRRGAYDSAILYLRDVVDRFPQSATARDARLRLVEAYREIRYREDAAEMCAALRASHPADAEVLEVCGPVPTESAATPAP